MKREDSASLIGKTYGQLTITEIDEERTKQIHQLCVFADCSCGVKHKSFIFNKLKRGETKSCGHLKKRHLHTTKSNKIDLYENFGIIWADEKPFLFDSSDIDLLNNRYWYVDDYGYLTNAITTNNKTKYYKFHRLVVGAQHGQIVDHINRDKRDNRKQNLRICTRKENSRNLGIRSNNTSGINGVYWDKDRMKWVAKIGVDGKSILIGRYKTKEDAKCARRNAEKQYFGEFAPINNNCEEDNEI